MQAVILAAGKGSRLAPITDSRSKGMLPILGKPILEHILEGLVASLDGAQCLRDRIEGPPAEAETLGTALAETLLEAGASEILAAIR